MGSMNDTLFDLEPDWIPLYKPFGLTLASILTPDRCRDCGRTDGRSERCIQGSRHEVGVFVLCDDCARLDPHWGCLATADEADALTAARAARRRAYLKRSAA